MFSNATSLQKLCVTMAKHHGSFNCLRSLRVGYWNVRSLVEIDGGVKTVTIRPKGQSFLFVCQHFKSYTYTHIHSPGGMTLKVDSNNFL